MYTWDLSQSEHVKESIIFYQNMLTFDSTDFSQITVGLKDIGL